MGDRLGVADSLLGLAAAVLPARAADAARLVATSAALRSVGGAVPTLRQEEDLASAVSAAGVAADGPEPTQQQAVALALELAGRPATT
jgi:hypothetical protein